MTKQEQIEEMANIPHKCIKSSCEECIKNDRKCADYTRAEALYNAGYRKVTDGATVLLVGKYNQALDEKTIEYFVKHNEQIRKETAREILQTLYNYPHEWHERKIKELAKEYGVEVKE